MTHKSKISLGHPWHKKPKKIDLSHTKIIEIPEFFKQIPSLIKLDLSWTRITEIRAGVFVNLPKLMILNLSKNVNLDQ